MKYDNILGAVLILLILSLITEKVANFLKLRTPRLAIPQSSLLFETARARAIQKRTIVVGIIVAILSKASLFAIFKPDSVFFWTQSDLSFSTADFDWIGFVTTLFGATLTGFFLSFGSKFFHDLLDLLLEVKNLKRKLADRSDWDFDTMDDVDSYLLTNDSAEAKSKIKAELDKIPGIEYYKIDYPKRIVLCIWKQKS
jgi:hypothetical protein